MISKWRRNSSHDECGIRNIEETRYFPSGVANRQDLRSRAVFPALANSAEARCGRSRETER